MQEVRKKLRRISSYNQVMLFDLEEVVIIKLTKDCLIGLEIKEQTRINLTN